MKRIFLIMAILLALDMAYTLDKIEASFVTDINFVSKNSKILIQWKNPDNFDNNITIYRNRELIDNPNKLKNSEKVIMLTEKEEKYIDTPGVGSFYYAVIITNKKSLKDDVILIPFRNYNTNPIEIKSEDSVKVKTINALANKHSINITWDCDMDDSKDQNLSLYRSTEPIINEDILKKSIKISSLKATLKFYVDIPIPRITYYYAIFVENNDEKRFIPDVTITTNGVSVESKGDLMNNFSVDTFIPLPLLSFDKDPNSGKYFNDSQILKNPKIIQYFANTKNVIESLKKDNLYKRYSNDKERSLKPLDFKFLNDEEIYSAKEYANEYETIIKHLKKGEYLNARFLLEQYITEMLPKDLLKRVSYYLGQICYMNKEYNYSYIYLVYSYNDFPKEVNPFLLSITNKIFDTLER